MLSVYQGKNVRITTEDGAVFTGRAETYPSGYGLHEFGVEEECIEVDGVTVFQSDVQTVEVIDEENGCVSEAERDALMGDLLEGPYYLADILPRQVPKDSKGQYFAVDRYFRAPGRYQALRTRFLEILLRLNCFFDMEVTFDSCETWERNPDPEKLVERAAETDRFVRFLFIAGETMIDLDTMDTYMTVYSKKPEILAMIRELVTASGLFFRQGE